MKTKILLIFVFILLNNFNNDALSVFSRSTIVAGDIIKDSKAKFKAQEELA